MIYIFKWRTYTPPPPPPPKKKKQQQHKAYISAKTHIVIS